VILWTTAVVASSISSAEECSRSSRSNVDLQQQLLVAVPSLAGDRILAAAAENRTLAPAAEN
jgi:hypothetical protein